MIHTLRRVYRRDEQKEVSCYHNSMEIITVGIYRLECDECEYVGADMDCHIPRDFIRDQEIDHNFDVLFRLVSRLG